MASNTETEHDPLNLLRNAIAQSRLPIPTTTADASNNTEAGVLEKAQYLLFNTQQAGDGEIHIPIELKTPTRFISQRANAPLDLISVYFCWLNKDLGVGEYIAATQSLNDQRTKNGLGSVTNVAFAEKLDLTSWLAGESSESEFVKNLDDNANTRKQAQGAADLARGTEDVSMGDADSGTASGNVGAREEERMKEIYASERTMGDRNSVLRGIKPTVSPLSRTRPSGNYSLTPSQDFSHVRKLTESFLRRGTSSRPTGPTPIQPTTTPVLRPFKPGGRRPEPIILLSPSASSLLRLSNIKSFLVDGFYQPPESSNTGANILYLTRTLPGIDPSRQQRFILVETPDNFKPDYWSRVVAVFTTGQAWQFKGYKWQDPAELFAHALGVYVGWRGEMMPESVKGWGRSVVTSQVDKFREGQTAQMRWRDREVVEEIWSAIEANMRAKGWAKEAR